MTKEKDDAGPNQHRLFHFVEFEGFTAPSRRLFKTDIEYLSAK